MDATSGATDASVPVSAMNSYLMNGIIGAAQAASQDATQVERELVSAFGMKVIEKLYGSETARRAGAARPTLAAAMPPPAAATAGAAATADVCAGAQPAG